MERLTGRYEMSGLACYAPNGKAILMRNLTQNALQKILDRLAAYEDAEERGELVRVVRCDGCVYHVDNGYHYCKKLRIDCPLSDFYCAYGKAALMEE